jgi:hypothetical protein
MDIIELENPHGVILSMGGQIPNMAIVCIAAVNILALHHVHRQRGDKVFNAVRQT